MNDVPAQFTDCLSTSIFSQPLSETASEIELKLHECRHINQPYCISALQGFATHISLEGVLPSLDDVGLIRGADELPDNHDLSEARVISQAHP